MAKIDEARKRDKLIKACEKIKKSIDDNLLWHSPICNFTGKNRKWCNCGIADMLYALSLIKEQKDGKDD